MSEFDTIDIKIDIARAIRTAVRSDTGRRVITLSVGGYSDRDISAMMDMPVKSVGEIRRRARIKVRSSLRGYL